MNKEREKLVKAREEADDAWHEKCRAKYEADMAWYEADKALRDYDNKEQAK